MNGNPKFASKYVSHYALRVRDLAEATDWYCKFLDARIEHDMGFGVFMTFDEEHHRLVIFTADDTAEKDPNAAGVEHVAFGLPDFPSLADNYERLKAHGITPSLPVNHGFTTSLYYDDPEGNQVELSVDNFASKDECRAWMKTKAMTEIMTPPYFGHLIDPEQLVQMIRSGASQSEIARLGFPL
ncbi:MAG: VOC family protein [Pyrinomonadaceae bacterium]|nr:VOC family protein [Pyrinomonadaceae bacterium]